LPNIKGIGNYIPNSYFEFRMWIGGNKSWHLEIFVYAMTEFDSGLKNIHKFCRDFKDTYVICCAIKECISTSSPCFEFCDYIKIFKKCPSISRSAGNWIKYVFFIVHLSGYV